MNVFSVSCVCLKVFSVYYGKCIQLTQNETVSILWASFKTKPFSFRYQLRSFPSVLFQKLYFVFHLSKWTKTCITTVVFEVALDVQSVKVLEYPFKQNRSMLKIKLLLYTRFYNIPLKDAQRKEKSKDNRKPFKIHSSTRIVTQNLSKWVISVTEMHCPI